MAATSRYANIRIDARRQIRILELHPGHYDDPITCDLRSYSEEKTEYEALSYTWGGTSRGQSISLNGLPKFAVTDNLYNALHRLRRAHHTRVLWIDAICINQDDLQERAQQVRMIGMIYRNASRVLIWLGDADEPAESTHSPFQPSQDHISPKGRFTVRPSAETDRKMRSFDAAIASTSPQWWTRTWIIQELVLAKNPVACFGEFELTWDEVGTLREEMSVMMETTLSTLRSDVITALCRDENSPSQSLSCYLKRYRATGFDGAYQVLNTLRVHHGTKAGLSELASTTPRNEATDPRDRVFGYFGLWSGADAGLLNVSYEKATSEVFADATFADIHTERNLRVLNLVRPEDAHRRGYPTWSLDFTFQNSNVFPPPFPVFAQRRARHAQTAIPSMSKNSRCLTVDAAMIDSIYATHPLPHSSLYPSPGEDQYLEQITRSIPISDSYTCLRRCSCTAQLSMVSDCSETAQIRYERIPPKTALAHQLGVQTDPISDIFLWWLMKVSADVPRQSEFSELFEWWKMYAHYQANAAIRGSRNPSVFVHTEHGFIGKALSIVRAGDKIVLLRGLELPAVVRPMGEHFVFLGLMWLNGGMMGELDDIVAATTPDPGAGMEITLV